MNWTLNATSQQCLSSLCLVFQSLIFVGTSARDNQVHTGLYTGLISTGLLQMTATFASRMDGYLHHSISLLLWRVDWSRWFPSSIASWIKLRSYFIQFIVFLISSMSDAEQFLIIKVFFTRPSQGHRLHAKSWIFLRFALKVGLERYLMLLVPYPLPLHCPALPV